MVGTVLNSEQECEDFVRGLCVMGTGGGGSPAIGLELLLSQLAVGRQIRWVDADSLAEGAWTATVAGVGGRGADGANAEHLAALGCGKEKWDSLGRMVSAVKALQEYQGIRVEAVVPAEIGASNVPGPIAVALELGLPIVDGDYCGGRAAPEMGHGVPDIRGVPLCPMSLVTRWGDVMILKDAASIPMADRIARMITAASYGSIAASWNLMQAKDATKFLAARTMTKALGIGRAIREARERGRDPVAEAVDAVGGWLVFQGVIVGSEIGDEQAYAFGIGSHTMRGVGKDVGHTFRVWYKNEFLISWRDERPFVTTPDSLIVVDLDTAEPKLSYDFAVGDHVAVIGSAAHEAYRSLRGIEAFGPRHFGFDMDYLPIEDKVREAP